MNNILPKIFIFVVWVSLIGMLAFDVYEKAISINPNVINFRSDDPNGDN